MKRIFSVLLCMLVLFVGCAAEDERLMVLDDSSIETFRMLFGEDYKHAITDDEVEFFYRYDRYNNRIEILNVDNRTVNWFSLGETLKYTDSANSNSVLKNGRRAYDYNDITMIDFVDRNIYFLLKEEGLTVAIADKSNNFVESYECEKLSSSLTPMLQQVLDSAKMLHDANPEYTGDYYLTLDYDVAIVQPQSVQLAKYDSIISLQLREVVPELLSYSFANSYTQAQTDITENKMIRDARGVGMYQNIVIYGQYYLCFSTDGSAQMLYNKERDFYEWVHDF